MAGRHRPAPASWLPWPDRCARVRAGAVAAAGAARGGNRPHPLVADAGTSPRRPDSCDRAGVRPSPAAAASPQAIDAMQRARFAAGQPPGRQAQPQRHVAQIAAHEQAGIIAHQGDTAEAVGLERRTTSSSALGHGGSVRNRPHRAPCHRRSMPNRGVSGGCHNRPMEPTWLESASAWISAHPFAAGAVIFLIAFCDALVILGIVVPALPLLFAVGALIGLGHINGPYALVCATLGAFMRRCAELLDRAPLGRAIAQRWPFSPLSAVAGPRRIAVPPQGMQEHRHRALRRRGAAVRARHRRHAAHAAAHATAAQPGRLLHVVGVVPRARLGAGCVL